MLDVDGEPNALELLVETPMKDNSTVKVTFQDKRNTGSVITSSNTVYCKLTDGYQPSALRVNVVDNSTLEVEFSEAMLRNKDVTDSQGNPTSDNYLYAADRKENYAIDAQSLDIYGVGKPGTGTDINSPEAETSEVISYKDNEASGEAEEGNVSLGVYRDGVDERHIVTIKLRRALGAGKHSLSISNVGDWAALTDGWRNIINTATVDFVVPEDTNRPDFEVEVQSPEQFKLKANCNMALVNTSNTIKTPDSSKTKSVIELQQQLSDGSWVTISNNGHGSDGSDNNNPIMVSRIRDAQTGRATNEYLVETTVDWTRVLNTKSTNDHYYRHSYRLHVAAGALKNTSNGLTNGEINKELTDAIMKSMDGTSPVIKEIKQATNASGALTSGYHVTFSEPVKLSDGSGDKTGANKEGMTPTQDRNEGTLYSADFIKKDTTQKTVPAEVNVKNFINAEDTIVSVSPTNKLDAGDWELHVRGVADDTGNTAATLIGTITVEAQTVTTNFKVVWAAVANGDRYSDITAGQGNYIFVKFNKPITLAGGSTNVGSTLNYQLNGAPLPTGSNIRAHIKGYDDHVDRIDSITIELPKTSGGGLGSTTMNYSISGLNSVLTISNAVTSLEGDTLSTEPGYNLPYQFGESGQRLKDSVYDPDVLTELGDATWGNAEDEKWDKITEPITTGIKDKHDAYVKALQAALASDKYRKIKLDPKASYDGAAGSTIKADLDISRIVDIDLNGCSIIGNISISTTDAANNMSIMNNIATQQKATIKGNSDNKKESVTLSVNTPNSSFELGNGVGEVDIKKGNDTQTNAINVNGVTPSTFNTQAGIYGNVVLSGSNMGFHQGGKGKIEDGKIIVNTTGRIYLRGEYNNDEVVEMAKAADLVLEGIEGITTVPNGLTVEAAAKGAKITVRASSFRPSVNIHDEITVIAKAPDIELRQATTDPGQGVTTKADGGDFIFQDESGTALDQKDSGKFEDAVESDGAEAWLNELKVIRGSEKYGRAAEIVTVGAITSGGSFLNGNEDMDACIKEQAKEKPSNKYEIVSVTPSVTGARYLEISSGRVRVKESVKDITSARTDRFTVAIKVKYEENSQIKEHTVTKTIIVCIDPNRDNNA